MKHILLFLLKLAWSPKPFFETAYSRKERLIWAFNIRN